MFTIPCHFCAPLTRLLDAVVERNAYYTIVDDAVLHCTALCCAVLRCAVLRCAVLRCAALSIDKALCCAALSHFYHHHSSRLLDAVVERNAELVDTVATLQVQPL